MKRLLLLLWLLSGWALAQPIRPVAGEDVVHTVAPGENLYTLGQDYSLAIEHLAFANRLPIRMDVAAGTRLTIPLRRVLPSDPPQDGLVVNLPERGVFLFRKGAFEKFFPVAIGQPGRFATPTGNFKLASRVVNPTWLPPEWAGLGKETVVPAGPSNPLGDRWMGLSMSGLGLHATTSPTSIGAAASHGCMRMYPASARDLFERVEVGMPVRIEYEPVKLGRDEAGSLFLVVYPDVYGRVGSLKAEVERVLERAGLAGLVEDASLDKLVASASGTPQQILAGDVSVTVDGQPLEASQPAMMASGSLWISSDVARALGMELAYDPATRTLTVKKADTEASYVVGEEVRMLGGKTLFPARLLLDRFGIAFRWEGPARTLHIGAGD